MDFFYSAEEIKEECELHDFCKLCKFKQICRVFFNFAPPFQLSIEEIEKEMEKYKPVMDEDTEELYNELITSKGYIPVAELAERFVDVDRYFMGEPWNLKQILNNINIIIPIEV